MGTPQLHMDENRKEHLRFLLLKHFSGKSKLSRNIHSEDSLKGFTKDEISLMLRSMVSVGDLVNSNMVMTNGAAYKTTLRGEKVLETMQGQLEFE